MMARQVQVLAVMVALVGCGGTEVPEDVQPETSSGGEAAHASDGLDGTAFEVSLGLEGESPVNDTLTFADGSFESSMCIPLGYSPASYSSESSGDGVTFRSTTESSSEGTIQWQGTVEGDRIEGSAVWTKPDGTVVPGQFSGARRL